MAKGNLNLKAVFSADTSGIKKGSNEAKQSIKDFESGASSILDQFTSLFGASFSQINTVLSSFKGGLLTAEKAMQSTAAATGGTTKAMKLLKVAIASTGIGLLITALASVVSYFTSTQRGAEKLQRILTPFKQIFAIIKDLASSMGEKIVWAFENPRQALSRFVDMLKSQLINRVKGIIDTFGALGRMIKGVVSFDWDEVKQGAKDYADAMKQTITGLDEEQRSSAVEKIAKAYGDAADKVARANALKQRQQAFQYAEIEGLEKIAQLENEINEARLASEDKERYSAEERQKFNRQALALTKQKGEIEKSLAKERYEMKVEENGLSESMYKDLKGESELKIALMNVDAQINQEMRRMVSKQQSLNSEVQKELDARKAALEVEQKMAERKALELQPVVLSMNVQQKLKESSLLEPIPVVVKPVLETEDFTGVIADFSKSVQGAVADLAVSFAEGIGGLLSGTGGMKNFMSGMIKTIANGISSIGKMLISLGTSMIALKKVQMNPWAAIAAGVAMVALAAAVSGAIGGTVSSMSSGTAIADGGTSATTAVQATVPALDNYTTEIRVVGELRGSGNDLIAVINNTTNVNNLTR